MADSDGLKVMPTGDREILMTRTFNAPRGHVFDALTKPELLKRWFGPPGWSLVGCKVDLRVGGAWDFLLRGPEGGEMGMRGFYREIVPPERLVHTETFYIPAYPGEAVVTTSLTENRGKTDFEATIRYETPEIRKAVLASNMEQGVTATYERLAELLSSLA